jgi:hypothetical protein
MMTSLPGDTTTNFKTYEEGWAMVREYISTVEESESKRRQGTSNEMPEQMKDRCIGHAPFLWNH